MRLLGAISGILFVKSNCLAPALAGAVNKVSSGMLVYEHAPKFYLAADVATISLWCIAQTSLFGTIGDDMFGRIITLAGLAAAIALGLLIQSTNPATAGPVGILAVFFCVYIIMLSCLTWGIYGANIILVEVLKAGLRKRTVSPMRMQKAYYFASVVALAPTILLAMNSVGTTSFYDIALVGTFVIIGVFYIQKRG